MKGLHSVLQRGMSHVQQIPGNGATAANVARASRVTVNQKLT